MLEVGVQPAVEDRVGDRAEHSKGVNDEKEGQLHLGFNLHPHRGLLDNLESYLLIMTLLSLCFDYIN